MKEIVKFDDLSRDDQIDILIQMVTAQEKVAETLILLATFSAYKLNNEDRAKYFEELTTEQIIENINSGLSSASTFEQEEKAWNIVIDVLGINKIFNIIDYIDIYIEPYNKITDTVDNVKNNLLDTFTLVILG